MTEAEWLVCTDPQLMLAFLGRKASDRKLRLFAVACCRAVWRWMTEEQFRRGVELMESHAETGIPEDKLESLEQDLAEAHNALFNREPDWDEPDYLAASMAMDAVSYPPDIAADMILAQYVHAVKLMSGEECVAPILRQLLVELFGNPFRPSPSFPPTVSAWNGATVIKFAQAIYDERRFADLPILADALEEAGSTDEAILSHCRQPGEHVRGCWVVDLLLGKA
jgi:hypothetical protein